ncbi:hypothetical protein JDV09_22070 [Mycobacterium sp. Y57]|uniref:hypothetical protein n=1 Tax=Mycolicibacterium xanthum TaxID=2796469 RepID=UPI001C8520B8|nr:hypothetical protein [Mycolicibacterium xanthum]MBX7434760.1 hypothetical protein [Mycolicibacterium xanthum]
MARTIDIKQAAATGSRRVWGGAVLIFFASIGVMLLATSAAASPLAYWAISSVALLTALVVLGAGECAWERTVADARAEGVIAR